MKGPRLAPLKVSKPSHLIHKALSSNSLDTAASKPPQQQRQPVIIYTHSPKVIHTNARDFMALVQKLTGLSSADVEGPISENKSDDARQPVEPDSPSLELKAEEMVMANLLSDNCSIHDGEIKPAFDPMFTPNTSFFSSIYPFHRFPETAFCSSYAGSNISPSIMDYLKSFQEL